METSDPLNASRAAAAAPAGPAANADAAPATGLPSREASGPISIPGSSGGGGADARGVMPDASPADPLLDVQTLERLLKKASPAVEPPRFSASDVLRDPSLQRAARRELAGVAPEPGPGSDDSSDPFAAASGAGADHCGEVDRQRAAVRELDEQVVAESRVNRGMAAVLVERLDSSRIALEGLAKLVGSLAEGQQAYAQSLDAAAKLTLAGDCDGASMRPAMAALAALPRAMGVAHSQLAALLRGLADGVRKLLREYQSACKEIRSGAYTVQRGIESGRRALGTAFEEHKAVCEAADAAAGRAGARGKLRGPEQDPWATEGRLVREHKALQLWQDKERAFLNESFARVQTLEAQRVKLTQAVAASLSDGYARALAPLPDAAAALAPAISGIDGEAELAELHRVALDTGSAAEALAARQAHAIEDASSDLFCSPEILRQGPMHIWDARAGASGGDWLDAHCVLTRAGFVHWFKSMEHPEPLDALNLGRCQFEQGKAPVFNLLETGTGAVSWLSGRQRKVTFKAPSVEECCEWAIALREGIAAANAGH
ncbi:hypothetical protein Rsub_03693 [Raphidocelis subcapitata]|uniref:PH domain-containing protein n=1 Tax=Raphidocelis subcapitata TaxID=307507 RepID=A0A2V0NU43_9CHLO|nr:hypothetical protein Rsub_03693 [Raphidocelis subcapitata]|eukprot:GBF90839.1 hypothetical protein Rsub_03693 [Raphidocelis subcapitata]